jgi:hypothetical protein
VRGINRHTIGEPQQLLVEAVVKEAGALLQGVPGERVRAANIADGERIPGQHRERLSRERTVGDQDADAL